MSETEEPIVETAAVETPAETKTEVVDSQTPAEDTQESTTEDEVIELTEEEIEAATKELEIAQQQPQPQPGIDYNQFAQTLASAIQSLAPKSPEPPKPWELDDFLANPKSFREGMSQWQKHSIEEATKPLRAELDQIKALLPLLYARSAEHPQFSKVQQRANELYQKHGIEYAKALSLASEEIAKQPPPAKPSFRTPPKHASAPDNRASSTTEVSGKGPADFRSIIAELRASGKYE